MSPKSALRACLLALPILGLILQCDRLQAGAGRPPRHEASDLMEVLRALPPRDEGRLGKPGDALNMVFLAEEPQLRAALSGAGWSEVPLSIADSVLGGALELWQGRLLTSFPPMQGYRVMERTQDMNWAKVIVPMETRHHFRLWRTGVVDRRGRELWWGSGNFDESIRYWDLSHRPNPDMDLERETVRKSLEASPFVEKLSLVALPQIPREGRNDNRYAFKTDGRALLVELK